MPERAVDAQLRIVTAVEQLIARSASAGDIAVVSHGAVGTLLLCHVRGVPISRMHDQLSQGHCSRSTSRHGDCYTVGARSRPSDGG